MNWLTKEINGKLIYFIEKDNSKNPRVTIRQLPNGRYIMEDKLLDIKKESNTFERLESNFLSEICVRKIELKLLKDNLNSISFNKYIDDNSYFITQVRCWLISNYSRNKKNKMKLLELNDGTWKFNWNFQGTRIEYYMKDKDSKIEKIELLRELHIIFNSKEKELNNVLDLFKEV